MNISSVGMNAAVGISCVNGSSCSPPVQPPPQASCEKCESSGLKNDILQALQSSGINVPPPPTGSQAAGNQTSPDQQGSGDGRQAMNEFLHSLFDALNNSGNSGESDKGSSNPINKYEDISTKVQNLISSLGSDSEQNSKLEDAFNKLADIFGSSSDESNSSLQDFLNNLLNNVNNNHNAQGNQSTGSILSVAV